MNNKMKQFNRITAIILFSASLLLFNACSNNSSTSKASDSDYSSHSSSSQQEQSKEVESTDGVYTGSQNISGLELVARLTVSGSRWSATSQLGSDSPEYQNGVVVGKDLFDDSGMIKIGYVSGNSASINGYPSMRK
jgi:uncharacterized protein with FMN-binding domain